MKVIDHDRLERFQKSRDYRASYIASRVRMAIAAQMRALREQFSGTQEAFSKKLGKPQSVISRLENPDYGKMSVQTLLDVAETLDITLVVKFVSYDDFFTLLDDDNLVPTALKVETFNDTLQRHRTIQFSEHIISIGLRQQISNGKRRDRYSEFNEYQKMLRGSALAKAQEPAPHLNPPVSEKLLKTQKAEAA